MRRQTFIWMSGGSSPTSFKKIVPPLPVSKRPGRTSPSRATPKSSSFIVSGGIAPQLTVTNFPFLRADLEWMYLATVLLPTPRSPTMSTVASSGASLSAVRIVAIVAASTAIRSGRLPSRRRIASSSSRYCLDCAQLSSSWPLRAYISVTSRTLVTTITMLLSWSKVGVEVMIARRPVLKVCSSVTEVPASIASRVPEREMTPVVSRVRMSLPSTSSRRRPLIAS